MLATGPAVVVGNYDWRSGHGVGAGFAASAGASG
jgi:hypothetical protein